MRFTRLGDVDLKELALSASLAGACFEWPVARRPFTVVNMARRAGVSARTLALAKAQEAVALRDAERIKREKQLEATLTDYYHAQGEVERIYSAAEVAAAPFDASIRDAVRALDRLGESRAGIAGLTGLSLVRVRGYLCDEVLSEAEPSSSVNEVASHRLRSEVEQRRLYESDAAPDAAPL